MATQYANGLIVTNGLQLMFDAGDRNSYPGSGTTWRDLATNRTSTITGAYSFNRENNGYFTGFDNNNSRINVNSPDLSTIGSSTIQAIFAYEGNQYEGPKIFDYQGASNNVTLNTGNGAREVRFFSDGVSRSVTWGSQLDNSTWTFVSGVRNIENLSMSISVNAQTRVTNTYASLPTFTPTNAYMICSNPSSGGLVVSCRLAVVLFYNRALSVAEETQNFNVLRKRFQI